MIGEILTTLFNDRVSKRRSLSPEARLFASWGRAFLEGPFHQDENGISQQKSCEDREALFGAIEHATGIPP
jgi:hypothetical protein